MKQKRKPISEAHKAAISRAQTGRPGYWTGKRMPAPVIEKMRAAKQGRHHTEATRQRIAEAGRLRRHSEATLAKLRQRCLTPEHRLKIGLAQRGEKSHAWKGGVCSALKIAKARTRSWRKQVLARDGHRCQWRGCGATESQGRWKGLHAHHILPFMDYPDLRYDVSNGITLCRQHHNQVERENRRVRNNVPSSPGEI
jgi:hypothetical protein